MRPAGNLPDNVWMARKLTKDAPLPQAQPLSAAETSTEMWVRLIEFKLVQGPGYRCAAYCDEFGQWRNADNNEELHGDIQVLG